MSRRAPDHDASKNFDRATLGLARWQVRFGPSSERSWLRPWSLPVAAKPLRSELFLRIATQ
jgi:hypothetical protein